MLSRESSEDHHSGRVYHISRGQLNAFQFRNTTFGDLYLKRKTEQRIVCFLLPCVGHVLSACLAVGDVWQERVSEPGHGGCVLVTICLEPKEG